MTTNKLRAVIAFVVITLFIPSITLAAQVFVVKSSNHPVFNQIVASIRAAEGIEYIFFNLDGKKEKATKIVERIKKEQPAAVVIVGPLATETVATKIAPIPTVVCGVANVWAFLKVGAKNAVAIPLNPTAEEQLEALNEVLKPRKLGVLASPAFAKHLGKIETWLAAHRIKLVAKQINASVEAPDALDEMSEEGVDALFMVPDKLNLSKQVVDILVDFSKKKGIPLYGLTPKFVQMGALLTLTSDLASIGASVSDSVEQIVAQRKKPQEVQLTALKFRIVLNITALRSMKHKEDVLRRLLDYSEHKGYPIVPIKER